MKSDVFALKLKIARLYTGKRQTQIEAETGISAKSISSWETGERTGQIKLEQLRALLRVYGLSLARFAAWQLTFDEIEMAQLNWRVGSDEIATVREMRRAS